MADSIVINQDLIPRMLRAPTRSYFIARAHLTDINPMRSEPDYILKIDGLATPDASQESRQDAKASHIGKPWIAVRWQCCSVYSRIYRNRVGTAYEGRCPKCGTPARAAIGPGGTNKRFFDAG